MSDAPSDHAHGEKTSSSFKSINKTIVPKSVKSPNNLPKAPTITSSQANSPALVSTTAANSSSSGNASGSTSTMSPWCQNCHTSTTPLWRRDESGQILCNACGLFLKLHGRSRPISLKTDTIKSRNRNKNGSSATDPSDSPVQTPKVPKQRKKKVKNVQKSSPISAAEPDSASATPTMTPVSDTPRTVTSNSTTEITKATPPSTIKIMPTLNMTDEKAANKATSSINNTCGGTASLSTSNTTEHLPSLLSTLEPGSATPYMSWAPSPSFNPLKSHLPSSLNSPTPLAPLKDIESIPFSPLRPPVNPIKSILSENTPNSTHTTPFLQAVTSPLLLASTTKHLQAKPLGKLKPLLSSGSALDQLSNAATSSPYLLPADVSGRLGDKLPSISNSINTNNGVSSTSSSVSSSATAVPSLSKTEEELQTRVSELELVNDLLKSRIGQLEDSEAAARESESIVRKSEMMLRVQVSKLEHRLERYRKRSSQGFGNLNDDDDSDLRLDDSLHKTYAAPQRKPEPSSVMMMLQPDKTEPLKKKLKTI